MRLLQTTASPKGGHNFTWLAPPLVTLYRCEVAVRPLPVVQHGRTRADITRSRWHRCWVPRLFPLVPLWAITNEILRALDSNGNHFVGRHAFESEGLGFLLYLNAILSSPYNSYGPFYAVNNNKSKMEILKCHGFSKLY